VEEEANPYSDGDWDSDEVNEANFAKVINLSSDNEDGVAEHNDPNEPRIEFGDDATGNDAWVWKVAGPQKKSWITFRFT